MYRILAGGDLIFDALSDSACVASASISQSVNAAAYLDMSVDPRGCPDIEEGVTAIEVLWDSETLFHGTVSETSLDMDGMLSVTAVSDVDALNRVLARPHSTDGSVGDKCPGTLSGYFQWLMSQFNQTNVGGYRIDVGVNQGDLIRRTGIAVSEDGYPTVASLVDSEVLSYGGYLDFTPFSGGGTIDLYADIHEASGQMVDFGQNVVDISVTRSTEGQRTAVIPYCGGLTISGASESDRQLVANTGLVASGDALYDPDAVARYGYREERYEVEGAGSVADLVREGIARLRTVMAPTVTIECRAVDMALYMEGYDHLRVGQAVRVRAEPLGVDEYLAVQDMALDLMDPSQTAYTLGVAYDTLTGGQSARLRELNLGIDHSIDVAAGAASAAQSAQSAAQSAHDAAQSAQDSADAAKGAASSAQSTADAAQSTADAAKGAADDAAKTATNYLGFSSGGLVVGDQTGASLGKNVLIDADSVDIRNGSEVLASFGDDRVDLGRNSSSAVIELCGGEVALSYTSVGGLTLNSGLYAGGAVSGSQLSSRGTLNVAGPLYLGAGKRTALRGFYTGTVVVTISGGTGTLFTSSQYQSLVGRSYKSGDVVLVCNGDRNANMLGPVASVNPSDGYWYINVPGAASGSASYRVNYLIVAVY